MEYDIKMRVSSQRLVLKWAYITKCMAQIMSMFQVFKVAANIFSRKQYVWNTLAVYFPESLATLG